MIPRARSRGDPRGRAGSQGRATTRRTRIDRSDASGIRTPCSTGGPPVEADPVLLLRREGRAHPVVDARVEHERGVDVVEDPGLGLQGLPAAALLGRGAHRRHRTGVEGQRGPGGERRSQAGGGDQVVAAGVPQAGQGVVLQQQRDRRPALPRAGHERRGHARRVRLHLETRAAQLAAQQCGGAVLGPVRDLRVDTPVHGVDFLGVDFLGHEDRRARRPRTPRFRRPRGRHPGLTASRCGGRPGTAIPRRGPSLPARRDSRSASPARACGRSSCRRSRRSGWGRRRWPPRR